MSRIPPRQRPPLQAVEITAEFVGGATRRDMIDGSAVLSIVAGDPTDTDERAYWCQALYAGEECIGFRLTKFGTGDVYDLPRDLSTCECNDRKYRPHRPGGCRHMAALRQALPTVAGAGAPPKVAADRKTERDDVTAAEAEAA